MRRITFLSMTLVGCAYLQAMDETFMQQQTAKIADYVAKLTPARRERLELIADPDSDHNKAVERIMEAIDNGKVVDLMNCFRGDQTPIDLNDFRLHGSALSYACWKGNADAVGMLLHLDAQVNHPGRKKDTPAIIVLKRCLTGVQRGPQYEALVTIFKNLLDHGADVTIRNEDRESAKSIIEARANRNLMGDFKLAMSNPAARSPFAQLFDGMPHE